MTVEVREAVPDDEAGVRRVLDAAMLVVREDLAERIDAGDVLVASEGEEAPVVGALVLVPPNDDAGVGNEDASPNDPDVTDGDPAHVDAVAVRRARRGQGVGSALVRTAAERHAPLTAAFDPDVRPFYESLGFEISNAPGDDDRLLGRFDGADGG